MGPGQIRMNELLNEQRQHWEKTFTQKPDMFGTEPSDPAMFAMKIFKKKGKAKILELGGGQGRDTMFLAQNGLHVSTLDYSSIAVKAIKDKAERLNLPSPVTVLQHDIRQPLPFDDESFDGCYSHMLYCMALTTPELEFLSKEVRRVLRPDGIHIYTVRNIKDSHYKTGTHRGEDMYEVSGFIVHFFSREKVEHLAEGYEIVNVDEFEEGELLKKLYRVTLRKI